MLTSFTQIWNGFILSPLLLSLAQSLGYQGEIGYQTFLYSSVKDWRKLLMFLLEKLPKDTAQTTDDAMGTLVPLSSHLCLLLISLPFLHSYKHLLGGGGVMLNRNIAAELSTVLPLPWTPSYCQQKSLRWTSSSNWHVEVLMLCVHLCVHVCMYMYIYVGWSWSPWLPFK